MHVRSGNLRARLDRIAVDDRHGYERTQRTGGNMTHTAGVREFAVHIVAIRSQRHHLRPLHETDPRRTVRHTLDGDPRPQPHHHFRNAVPAQTQRQISFGNIVGACRIKRADGACGLHDTVMLRPPRTAQKQRGFPQTTGSIGNMLGRGFQCERHRVIDAILNASGALRDAQTLLRAVEGGIDVQIDQQARSFRLGIV